MRPVGFYRSDIGETFALTSDDLDLMTEFFPQAEAIALLIHPAVLKAPTATILVRGENGSFQREGSVDTFPFRRRELTGGASEKPQGEWNRHSHRSDAAGVLEEDAAPPAAVSSNDVELSTAALAAPPAQPRSRIRGSLAALVVALLALGAAAGDWYARRQGPDVSASTLEAGDPYAMHLNAAQRDSSVLLRWDRNANVIRSAQQGRLTIAEGEISKTIELDGSQLRDGSVLYRHVAPEIRFRLEVLPAKNRSVAETLVWHPEPAK